MPPEEVSIASESFHTLLEPTQERSTGRPCPDSSDPGTKDEGKCSIRFEHSPVVLTQVPFRSTYHYRCSLWIAYCALSNLRLLSWVWRQVCWYCTALAAGFGMYGVERKEEKQRKLLQSRACGESLAFEKGKPRPDVLTSKGHRENSSPCRQKGPEHDRL
jgi:hypothetical protein